MIFQKGINGKHIKYDHRAESYAIDPALGLNVTVRDTVLCICELGWLYMKVNDYLKKVFGGAISTSFTGLVVQSFGFALQVTFI